MALYYHILLDLLEPGLEGVCLGRSELLPDLDAPELLPIAAWDLEFTFGALGFSSRRWSMADDVPQPEHNAECRLVKEQDASGKVAHAVEFAIERLGLG